MQTQTSAATGQETFYFSAKVANSLIVANALQPISWKKDQKAKVTINSAGVRFTVEEGSYLQAKSFLRAEVFQQYYCKENETFQFQVNMTVLLDCLSVFSGSTNTALQLRFPATQDRLMLILEEGGVLTDCSLSIFEPEEVIKFNFRATPCNKIVIEGLAVHEGLAELDWDATSLQFTLSPQAPYFRVAAEGPSSSMHVDFPKDDTAVVNEFACDVPLTFSYRPSLVQPAVRGLQTAKGVCVRINRMGLLSIMRQLMDENQRTSWVEFLVCPNEDASGDDGDPIGAPAAAAAD